MGEHHLITGGAGFIGSHLTDRLLARGLRISVVDDLSLGKRSHLPEDSDTFAFLKADASDVSELGSAVASAVAHFGPVDHVWHLAANSDISAGVADASVDLGKTFMTSFALSQVAKQTGIRKIAFASTSAVYGELPGLLTEDRGPLLPISNYGAAKLASEAILSASAETHLDRVWIFRFPNVVGPHSTHGAIHDFAHRLRAGQSPLKVLGDGTQQKTYLFVGELVEAMTFIVENAGEKRNVFNIGPEGEGTTVRKMAEVSVARNAPGAGIEYGEGDRGWVGDVPKFEYSTQKLATLGWRPELTSDGAIERAIDLIATGLEAVSE
jgi:UDP-glucose 4-epimerase